jgi:hypothetical protein
VSHAAFKHPEDKLPRTVSFCIKEMLVALFSMQRAYDLVPGNYYAVLSKGTEYTDVYFIRDDTKNDFRIFGVSSPREVLRFITGKITGGWVNADNYIASRHKTKIFESLEFHTTKANEPDFVELQTAYAEDNRSKIQIDKEKLKTPTIQDTIEMQRADNARIIAKGPVVGRYYSISSEGSTFIDVYFICIDRKDPDFLILGIQPPSAIKTYLMANTNPDSSIITIKWRYNIYTRTANKAHEANSSDFRDMRNLLMNRLGFHADDPQRKFDIIDDDVLTQASPIESDPESKESKVLRKLDDNLKKIIEGLDGIRKELNDR